MRVDGNDPAFETDPEGMQVGIYSPVIMSNIPIRLEIASRLMQAAFVSPHCPSPSMHYENAARQALINADVLIRLHNEDQQEKKE